MVKKKRINIRKERYSGSMSRSFYVGDEVTQDEIQAKYEDGILRPEPFQRKKKPL